jgi:hypothetical protein
MFDRDDVGIDVTRVEWTIVEGTTALSCTLTQLTDNPRIFRLLTAL